MKIKILESAKEEVASHFTCPPTPGRWRYHTIKLAT